MLIVGLKHYIVDWCCLFIPIRFLLYTGLIKNPKMMTWDSWNAYVSEFKLHNF